VDQLFILGDLTNQKDNHSAALVNRLVKEITNLSLLVKKIRILKGNHDFDNPDCPFFGFFSLIPNVLFHSKPVQTKLFGKPAYFIPNIPALGMTHRKKFGQLAGKFEYVFLHQCFTGAVASNGHRLTGAKLGDFTKLGKTLIAGDIHKPQQLKNLHYVGSPHPVHFGDEFEPRVLLLSEKGMKWVPRITMRKRVLKVASYEEFSAAANDLDLTDGDQIRVIFEAQSLDHESWAEFKRNINEHCLSEHIALCGMEARVEEVAPADSEIQNMGGMAPAEIVKKFCEENDVSLALRDKGLAIVKE